jgi:plastocyanin
MPRPAVAPLTAALALAAVAAAEPALAQQATSVVDRTPNLVSGWLAPVGTIQFNFLHRFTESGGPEHQIDNVPTFVVATGAPGRSTLGFAYSTSSDVAPGRPNEWEFFGRVVPFALNNGVADLSLQLGYNWGAASTDAELQVARSFGPLRLMAAGRGFTNAYRAEEGRTAVVGGAAIRLGRYVSVSGDAGSLLDRRDGERMAWSAGLQLGVAGTPHSLSLHATNSLTGTLEGVSRGTPRTRYGFEYTVPFTLARYIPAFRSRTSGATVAGGGGGDAVVMSGDTARVNMNQLAYEPARIEVKAGTVVVFTNNAPLVHTVTADDKSFDSGNIDVGKSWTYTFSRAGTFPFHCVPHPFMKGVVVVR